MSGRPAGLKIQSAVGSLRSESFRAEDEALRDELDGTGNLVGFRV